VSKIGTLIILVVFASALISAGCSEGDDSSGPLPAESDEANVNQDPFIDRADQPDMAQSDQPVTDLYRPRKLGDVERIRIYEFDAVSSIGRCLASRGYDYPVPDSAESISAIDPSAEVDYRRFMELYGYRIVASPDSPYALSLTEHPLYVEASTWRRALLEISTGESYDADPDLLDARLRCEDEAYSSTPFEATVSEEEDVLVQEMNDEIRDAPRVVAAYDLVIECMGGRDFEMSPDGGVATVNREVERFFATGTDIREAIVELYRFEMKVAQAELECLSVNVDPIERSARREVELKFLDRYREIIEPKREQTS
jgi:hypothetical protein